MIVFHSLLQDAVIGHMRSERFILSTYARVCVCPCLTHIGYCMGSREIPDIWSWVACFCCIFPEHRRCEGNMQQKQATRDQISGISQETIPYPISYMTKATKVCFLRVNQRAPHDVGLSVKSRTLSNDCDVLIDRQLLCCCDVIKTLKKSKSPCYTGVLLTELFWHFGWVMCAEVRFQ